MHILLDKCVHAGVKAAFQVMLFIPSQNWDGEPVKMVRYYGWAQNSFDVFVTIDGKLEYQQNLRQLPLGIVIAHVFSNRIDSFKPIFQELAKAVEAIRPGQVVHVSAPKGRSNGIYHDAVRNTRWCFAAGSQC